MTMPHRSPNPCSRPDPGLAIHRHGTIIDAMFDVAPKDFDAQAWDAAVADLDGLSLVQTWAYGEAKARTGPWRVERGEISRDGRPVALFQALIRNLPMGLPRGLAWINRAPLRSADDDGAAPLADCLAALNRHFAEQRGLYLRVAPPVFDATPVEDVDGLRPAAAGWASAILDLTPPAEDLRRHLKGKWRGHLNKGERAGLDVRSGADDDLFAAFVDHHRQLIEDRGFATTLTPDLLACLQDLLPNERKMTVWLAYRDGDLLGSVLMARYGDTCEYLAGNINPEGRRLNTGQVLLWQALTAMREAGCRRLDVSGMDPDTTPDGILTFKQGLGATPYRLTAELESAAGGLLARLVRWRVGLARPT